MLVLVDGEERKKEENEMKTIVCWTVARVLHCLVAFRRYDSDLPVQWQSGCLTAGWANEILRISKLEIPKLARTKLPVYYQTCEWTKFGLMDAMSSIWHLVKS